MSSEVSNFKPTFFEWLVIVLVGMPLGLLLSLHAMWEEYRFQRKNND